MSFIEGNPALCQHSLLRYWSMPEVVFSVWRHKVIAVIKWDVIQWHMPAIPALEKWRQEEQDFKTSFEASLGYVSYCLGEQRNKQRPRRFQQWDHVASVPPSYRSKGQSRERGSQCLQKPLNLAFRLAAFGRENGRWQPNTEIVHAMLIKTGAALTSSGSPEPAKLK